MNVILNRRIYLKIDCKILKISQNFEKKILYTKNIFDFEIDDDYDNVAIENTFIIAIARIHNIQISHISIINRVNYNNDVELRAKFTKNLFAIYFQINRV